MAPRGGSKKNTGLRREDAARDRMKDYGFEEPVINESIRQLLKVYGEDQWILIEDSNYAALLSVCLEKQDEQAKQLAAEKEQEQEKEAGKAVMNSTNYAHHSFGGAESSHRGWPSSDEETDPDEDSDSDDDDDDEIIHLTPEPLCEELEELLRESRRR